MKVLKKPGMEGHTVRSKIMGMPYGMNSTVSINMGVTCNIDNRTNKYTLK